VFHDPHRFPFVAHLEAAFGEILREVDALDDADFVESPDSLTTVSGGYDETGWRYFALDGEEGLEENRARCPLTARACAAVPGLVNAGFSLLRPGSHLHPHRGELRGVLRCHLALVVPSGNAGLRVASDTRHWQPGRCLVFDDTIEHEAWNRGDGNRVVLIVTFRPELTPSTG
jgi:ornithine lipid ester-linked acyl 2-hydroxylase